MWIFSEICNFTLTWHDSLLCDHGCKWHKWFFLNLHLYSMFYLPKKCTHWFFKKAHFMYSCIDGFKCMYDSSCVLQLHIWKLLNGLKVSDRNCAVWISRTVMQNAYIHNNKTDSVPLFTKTGIKQPWWVQYDNTPQDEPAGSSWKHPNRKQTGSALSPTLTSFSGCEFLLRWR